MHAQTAKYGRIAIICLGLLKELINRHRMQQEF